MNRRDFLRAIAAAPTVGIAGRGEGMAAGIITIGRRVGAWLERRRFVRALRAMAGMMACANNALEQLAVPVKTTAQDIIKFEKQMRGVLDALEWVIDESGDRERNDELT